MSILEKPIYDLLHSEPYFAHFLLNSQVIYDAPGVETAGASIRDSTITFVINTSFFGQLSAPEQAAVLKHEVMHVLLEHCGTRVDKKTWKADRNNINIAMDCAINQYIKGLPDKSVTLNGLSKQLGKELLPFETWEYYYHEIRDFAEKNPDKCRPSPNDHEYMLGSDESMSSEQMKAVVKDASDKASKEALPEGLQNILGRLTTKAAVDWKRQLRNIIASVKSPMRKNTRMRPNRRYELEQPGKKKIKTLILGVCCDSSGSVSDEAYMMFMREIESIAKNTAITYLIHADAAVHKVDMIKDGKPKQGVLSQRHGYGGTAYQPAIDYCMAMGCDAIVYFGDMDSADSPKNPGVPFIWARVGNQEPPGRFGQVVEVR